MPEKSRSAIGRAIEFIEAQIAQGTFVPGRPLPRLADLSRMAGVSVDTVWKATQELQKQGLLRSVRGHYLTVPQTPGSGDSGTGQSFHADRPPLLWEKVKRRLSRDILNRIFAPGTSLPSSKELQSRYAVNFRTLQKALAALVDESVLVPQNRGYAVPSLSTRKTHAGIVLVGHYENNYLALGMHDETFLRSLEAECAQAGIPLELVGVEINGKAIVTRQISGRKECSLIRGDAVLGYLYLSNIANPAGEYIVHTLAGSGKPLAVLDETGAWSSPRRNMSSRTVRFFQMTTSPVPARQIARYLLNLGHRKIAYISPFHANVWSVKRLEGLRSVYEFAGIGGNVVPFVENLTHKQAGFLRTDFEKIRNHYSEWRKQIPDEFKRETDPVMEHMQNRAIRWGELRYKLNPLFAKVRSDPEITAWVFPTDFLGTIAQDYLHETGDAVPDDISVLSFDDSYRALRNSLTSYNFNIPAVVNAMLGFVTNSSSSKIAAKNRIVEIEGVIVERGSAGPARLQSRR
ncbi:MAG: GntR family transcriptional regulator [Chitinivibrionales bacterium]|nr:GntR family transcriptional regulator [Chitinivibrionales bacterium]